MNKMSKLAGGETTGWTSSTLPRSPYISLRTMRREYCQSHTVVPNRHIVDMLKLIPVTSQHSHPQCTQKLEWISVVGRHAMCDTAECAKSLDPAERRTWASDVPSFAIRQTFKHSFHSATGDISMFKRR